VPLTTVSALPQLMDVAVSGSLTSSETEFGDMLAAVVEFDNEHPTRTAVLIGVRSQVAVHMRVQLLTLGVVDDVSRSADEAAVYRSQTGSYDRHYTSDGSGDCNTTDRCNHHKAPEPFSTSHYTP
jgi:hypothetical protein